MIEFYLLQTNSSSVPVLIAIALIVIIGYVGRAIFNRTKIPETLILILIGLLLVPIGHLLPVKYVDALRSLASIFGNVALVVIMYNGGRAIVLNRNLLRNRKGIYLGILDVLLPIIVITAVMSAFGWPLIYGALLGAILGETSTVIVIPIIKKIRLPADMYSALVMETTLNSDLAILAFTLLLSFAIGQTVSAGAFANFAVDYVSVAIAFGLVAGVLWLVVQSYIRGAREYLASLAMAILLYGVVGLFNGASVISVLIFAIILGNYKLIVAQLGINIDIKRRERGEMDAVGHDIEFLIITFFFVFTGMIAVLSWHYLAYAIVVTAVLCVLRYPEVAYILGDDKGYRDLAFALMQRGAAVAVLAAILFSIGGSYFDQIFYICFMVIILTNVIGSFLLRRTKFEVKK